MRPSAKHSAKTVPTLRDMTTCQRQRTTKKYAKKKRKLMPYLKKYLYLCNLLRNINNLL